ncbi:MAG: site-specific integrase [archaeon]
MSGGRIDVHGRLASLESSLKALRVDLNISVRNRDFIFDFLRDAELGKTVLGRQKKKLGVARRHKYVGVLKNFALWVGRDFDKVKMADMERVIGALENDGLKKRDGRVYSDETKVDYKKMLKKFYKWLLGNNVTYPEMVSWFDTSLKEKDTQALSRQEVERLVEHGRSLLVKAAIMVLFDSGARIEEFLNIRLRHFTRKDDYFLVRIEFSKTKPRTVGLPLCTGLLDELFRELKLDNPEDLVFPFGYDAFRMTLARLGKKVLRKPVYPHLLRHSSATYYANIEKNYFRFCKRYGWTFGSRMAQRYIDRAGIEEQETAKAVQVDEVSKVKADNVRLREDMRMMKSQIDRFEKYGVILDEAFRKHPEIIDAVKKIGFQKAKEGKL